MKRKPSKKKIVPQTPYSAMLQAKRRLEVLDFQNSRRGAEYNREMHKRAHSIYFESLQPAAREKLRQSLNTNDLAAHMFSGIY